MELDQAAYKSSGGVAKEEPGELYLGEKAAGNHIPGPCQTPQVHIHHVLSMQSRRPPSCDVPSTKIPDDFSDSQLL